MGRLKTLGTRVQVQPSRLRAAEPDRQARRALPTNSTEWRRLRAEVLDREPLCRICAAAGRLTAANHVDHIDGNSHNNAPTNLQPLCAPCHSRKTVTEDGGWGRTRKT